MGWEPTGSSHLRMRIEWREAAQGHILAAVGGLGSAKQGQASGLMERELSWNCWKGQAEATTGLSIVSFWVPPGASEGGAG